MNMSAKGEAPSDRCDHCMEPKGNHREKDGLCNGDTYYRPVSDIDEFHKSITDLQAENERLRDIIRRYMDCDGSNGTYNASKYYEIKEEARAALNPDNH